MQSTAAALTGDDDRDWLDIQPRGTSVNFA
jgi:hypothetical protein